MALYACLWAAVSPTPAGFGIAAWVRLPAISKVFTSALATLAALTAVTDSSSVVTPIDCIASRGVEDTHRLEMEVSKTLREKLANGVVYEGELKKKFLKIVLVWLFCSSGSPLEL